MDLAKLLLEIDNEIDRLRQVRELLAGNSPSQPATRRKKRTLSPEARARIAEAQRRRWSKAKSGL
ncbi:hypothetical protein ACFPT7_07725 [Acidicapsa dinghuensis]|uniref:Uncharacterized protein n=1 Tax=Acidicapsa dinghuensis TaxID=2218256 RepID=A0ABW1ECY5_9BACT|nr:hypothetical protein [Acidicapsa dinghuensis]